MTTLNPNSFQLSATRQDVHISAQPVGPTYFQERKAKAVHAIETLERDKLSLEQAVSLNARQVAHARRLVDENVEDGVQLSAKLASIVAALDILKSA